MKILVQLIIRKCKHVKAMPITVEQYLQDQPSSNRNIGTLEDILSHFEIHPQQGDDTVNQTYRHRQYQ